ncbi:hypothetical protein RCH18_002054 [Flavobacterium sp. PL11]|nr:hypothetical protein [Flavobacterium sp. PL11]
MSIGFFNRKSYAHFNKIVIQVYILNNSIYYFLFAII